MTHLTASTAQELQDRLIALADEDTLILTAGGRLARRLRHGFRTAQIRGARRAWFPPRTVSLNAWLTEIWKESWPEESLVTDLGRLRFWEKSVRETELPEGLEANLTLYQALDQTYSAAIRHKLPRRSGSGLSPLIAWRDEVVRRFEDRLRSRRMVHPAFLPGMILDMLRRRPLILPKRVFCVGFEAPAPVEQDILDFLAKEGGATRCLTELKERPAVAAVTLPNTEQEVLWLAREVLQKAQDTPLHRIGVVIPDMNRYAAPVFRIFQELAGEPAEKGTGSYNVSLGGPLLAHPLVQAALLPLKFMLEGQKRTLLLALLLSPYYGCWSRSRETMARADLVWRSLSVDRGLNELLDSLQGESPALLRLVHPPGHGLDALLRESSGRRRSAREWVEYLSHLWHVLGFPVIRREGEDGAYKRLRENLALLAAGLGTEEMDAGTFYAWLRHALAETAVNVPGHEEAGIQIIGLVESRGLSFDHLFVVGLAAGSMPQAVRQFPFLSREEKRLIQGATVESQYEFAAEAFKHLMTLAPAVTLTRPREQDGDPVPASSFWPEEETETSVDCWLRPAPALVRAGWLCRALEGWRDHPISFPPEDVPPAASPCPAVISVSALETAISCPFRFFAGTVLRIDPLEEPAVGIPPQEKGNVLHRLLALFTSRMRAEGVSPAAPEQAEAILQDCMAAVLAGLESDPGWQIEKRRWLDDESSGHEGLLRTWLSLEREREGEGWRWLAEETPFEGLTHASWPFLIKGRIDRIDVNAADGRLCCWDYKTGNVPLPADVSTKLLAPQLPCYLLATRAGRVGLTVPVHDLDAGYIALKLEGEVQVSRPLSGNAAWADCLAAWEETIAALGRRLSEGRFQADPNPAPRGSNDGACRLCPYGVLCKKTSKS